MNRWNILKKLEEEIRDRDKSCVYCGISMITSAPRGATRKAVATWEHIINDATIVTRENIALCCVSCNSSKGTKILADWMRSDYCKRNGISEHSVAPIVRQALRAMLPDNHR